MKLLIVDNFDSFTYNLAQAFGALGAEPVVIRSDRPLSELTAVDPGAVVISPGPGTPKDAGVSLEAIEHFGPKVPVLGVCLGHQCIGSVYGGRVDRAPLGPVHGKTSEVTHDDSGVFRGIPSPFTATRYHSLAVKEDPWPETLVITARSDDGIVMGVRHRELPVEGVQFHPESILTFEGPTLLANFLRAASSYST
jgi:anthranilate synthase component 2/para-aminobenzoate synthetase component 2